MTRMSKYLLVIRICKIIYYQVLSKQHLIDGANCDIKIPDKKKRVSHFSPIRYLVGLLTKDNFNQKGTFDKLVPRKESSLKTRSRLGVERDIAVLQEFLIPGVLWGYFECIHFSEIIMV